MVLDLTGMTAWLRARGASLEWPAGARRATGDVANRLARRGNAPLAKRIRDAVSYAMATPVRANGNVRPANRLLDLVDEAEKALK